MVNRIISWLKSRAGPKNWWSGVANFFFGSTPSGKVVNERTAMQTTAVYACVRILAETIASLPLHTYRYELGYYELVK